MPVCTYGGEKKSGVADYVWLNEVTARSILPSWLHFVIPYIPGMSSGELLNTADLCSVEPPVEADFPLVDLAAAIFRRDFAYLSSMGERFLNYYKSQMWGTYCQCKASATTCPTFGSQNFGNLFGSVNRTMFGPYAWPQGATGVTVSLRNNSQNCGGGVRYWFPGTTQAATVYNQANDTTTVYTLTKGAGATNFLIEGNGNHTNSTCWWQITCNSIVFTGPCTTGGGTYTPPVTWTQPANLPTRPTETCTTTADLCALMDRLTQRIGILNDLVVIIQRQAVPFAYIEKSSQAITGTGVVAVQGILAASVDFTAIPSRIGGKGSNPAEYFQLGWISFGTADGWGERKLLRHDPQYFALVGGEITKIGYSLAVGAAAVLKTYQREP